MIFLSMLLLGALIGFVGAGGAGVTITLLTVGFNIPIHIALGVALSSMVFTMISGVISHLRENEVELKTGLIIGLGGVIGAFVGAKFSTIISENILSIFTALMIILSALILYIKVYHIDLLKSKGYCLDVPIVITNMMNYTEVVCTKETNINIGENLLLIK